MKRNSLLTLLALLALSLCVFAQEKTAAEQYAIKAKPLIQQCEELKDGEDATVAKVTQDLKTAEAAGKIQLAEALGKSCHKKSADPLQRLLQDKDPLVRVAAVEALAQLGDEAAIDPLVELVKDPDWRVRFAVGPALCAFQKQTPSYAALNYLGVTGSTFPLNEEDARARCNAFLALEQMHNVSFSRKPLFYLFSLQDQQDEKVRQVARETLLAFKDTRNGTRELIALLKQTINPSQRRNCAYWLGQHKAEIGRHILTEVAANDADETVRKTAAESLKLLGPGPVDDTEPATPSPKKKTMGAPAKAGSATKAAPKSPTKKPAKK